MRRRIFLTGVLTVALSAAAAQAAPPLEPVEIKREVTFVLPEDTKLSGFVTLAPDQRHLLLPVDAAGQAHLGVTNLRGRDYRCITCGAVGRAQKAEAFEDGKRVWFADNKGDNTNALNPASGGTGDFQWSVLECSPSIYDCLEHAVLPVKFPIASLTEGAQNREAKPDPDGKFVSWNEVRTIDGTRVSIARLVREDERYVLADQRILNPQFDTAGGEADWVHGGRFYEGAKWFDGATKMTYQTTGTALNYDIWSIDLRTGERNPVTTDIDYNEVSSFSPDGNLVWYTGARGLDRMKVFTQLRRPSLIDMSAFGQVGRVGLWNNRGCIQGGWLMDATHRQRDGYSGQPVLLGDDVNARKWDWFNDGVRALVSTERYERKVQGKDGADSVYVVRLPARKPTTPTPHVPMEELPWEEWTVPAAEYTGMAARPTTGHVLQGPGGGTATLNFAGGFFGGTWTVTYAGYSSDRTSFVDGTESIHVPNPIVSSRWQADLTIRGEQNGYLRGDITTGVHNSYSGTVESEVDGVLLNGVPTNQECPGMKRPRLRPQVVRRSTAGRHEVLRVAVTASLPGEAAQRPVRAATVRLRPGGRRYAARTGRHGMATLRVPRVRITSRTMVRARAGSFRGGAVMLDESAARDGR